MPSQVVLVRLGLTDLLVHLLVQHLLVVALPGPALALQCVFYLFVIKNLLYFSFESSINPQVYSLVFFF